ncbi:MAG: hypothetical protein ABI045_04095 [Flavobacteriales bacterium]
MNPIYTERKSQVLAPSEERQNIFIYSQSLEYAQRPGESHAQRLVQNKAKKERKKISENTIKNSVG